MLKLRALADVETSFLKTKAGLAPLSCVDPFRRDVVGIMGIPVDDVGMEDVINEMEVAAASGAPFLLSTPNLNYLVLSQKDDSFREVLLQSALCPADGMFIVLLARLLGVSLKGRVAGSDIFDELRFKRSSSNPLKVFLFGGSDGLAAEVAQKINAQPSGLACVGAISPGWGDSDALSSATYIDRINASAADFLATFLTAEKGQDWMMKNRDRLKIPIRAGLGSTLNYQSGKVRRAPPLLARMGLEWAWRVKEEPHLWRRYLRDGFAFMGILLTSVLPILVQQQLRSRRVQNLELHLDPSGQQFLIEMTGPATLHSLERLRIYCREAATSAKDVTIDVSDVSAVDPHFFGLLLLFRKMLKERGMKLNVICRSKSVRRLFQLHRFAYLLTSHSNV